MLKRLFLAFLLIAVVAPAVSTTLVGCRAEGEIDADQ